MKNAWDQLEGEYNEAYARFLVYRNLGPSRSLDAAYAIAAGNATKRRKTPQGTKRRKTPQGTKRRKTPQRANGQWNDDSSKYNWQERATAWDIHQLDSVVPGSVATIYKLIGEFARVTLEQIQSGKVKPRTWPQTMAAVDVLASFITPESANSARAAMVAEKVGAGADPGPGAGQTGP